MSPPNNRQLSILLNSWDVIYILANIFVLWEVPVRLVTGYQPAGGLGVAIWAAAAILLLGVPLHFLAEKTRGNLPARKKTFVSSLKGNIAFGLLSSLPLDLLLPPSVGMPWALFRWIRVLRIAEAIHLNRTFDLWQREHLLHPAAGRLVMLLFWILVFSHFIAIGWIPLGGTQGAMPADLGQVSQFTKPISTYITSLYWAVATLSSVGYGDISAKTDIQRLYATFVMLTGVGLFGYAIGNIATLIANLDMAKAAYQQKLDEVNAFLHHKRVPAPLMDKVNAYYRYLWDNRMVYPHDETLTELPISLRTEIALVLNRRVLERVNLLQNAGEAFLREVVLLLKPKVYLPGDYVFRQGDLGDAMYFVSRGSLEVLSDDPNVPVITLCEGDCFGEIALTQRILRTRSVRALTFCDLYELGKDVFDQLLAKYPEFKRQIEHTAQSRN